MLELLLADSDKSLHDLHSLLHFSSYLIVRCSVGMAVFWQIIHLSGEAPTNPLDSLF